MTIHVYEKIKLKLQTSNVYESLPCFQSKTQIYQKSRKPPNFLFHFDSNASGNIKVYQSWKTVALWHWFIYLQLGKLNGIVVESDEHLKVLSGGIFAAEVLYLGSLPLSTAMPFLMHIQIQTTYRYRWGDRLYLIFPLGYSLLSESL